MLIALGVTGGIGAYKAVEVCRGLQKQGHDVVAVMTRAATRFVGPVTFEAITRRPVITSQWKPGMNADIEHVAIADSIDLLPVAPCTANVIGKFANGIADDFLTSLYLATKAPVLLAPAMNTNMLAHEAVQRNLQTLASRGVRRVVVLERRFLASGGTGRSVGIIRQLYPTLESTQMVKRSLEVFQRFDERVGGACGFVETGALIGVSPAMRATLERTLALEAGKPITQARAELDQKKRLAQVYAIQKRLEQDAARPILGWRLDYFTIWPHVKNLVPHQSIYNFGRMQEVWRDG